MSKSKFLNVLKVGWMFFTCAFLFGCNNALNRQVYEPLVNGKAVTIELININDACCPGKSLENAVAKFDEYVLGDVRLTLPPKTVPVAIGVAA